MPEHPTGASEPTAPTSSPAAAPAGRAGPHVPTGAAAAPHVHTGTAAPHVHAAVPAPRVGQSVGARPCENYPAPSSAAAGIVGALATHAQHAPQVHREQQGPQPEVRPVTTCECRSTLVASQVQIGVGPAGIPAYLYVPEGFKAWDQHMQASASRLYVLVITLLSKVFKLSLGANRIFVYYDPGSSTIAFNKGQGQQLWFNAAVKVSSRGFSSEGEARVRFWFLVCAHELAHNTVSGHDSGFSDVCSSIVLQYAGAYEAFAHAYQHLY